MGYALTQAETQNMQINIPGICVGVGSVVPSKNVKTYDIIHYTLKQK